MPLDTSIISQATFQPIQFKSPDRVNMLLQAAQAAQAVQGLEAGREERQAARMGAERDAMLRQRLGAIQNAGETPESLLQYADVLEQFGSPQMRTEALKLRQSAFEAKRFKDALAQADGAPVAAPGMQPTPGVAPGMAAAPVVATGAAPANAMAAAPSAANQLAAPRQGPPDVRGLVGLGTDQGIRAANVLMDRYKLGQGAKDEATQRMERMGLDPSKQSDWAEYYKITQPGAVINERRLELDRQRADLETRRFAASQAKSDQDRAIANRNLALSERRFDLAVREFDRNNDPEFQARMASAKAVATEAAKSDVAAINEAPAAIEAGQRTLALLNRMVGDPKGKGDATKPHPGFTGVVGATFTPGMRLVPGTPEADFDRMLEQVLGGAFLEAYERLKGTGQITEIEGQKATQAITRMGRAVSESEFLAAATEFRAAVETALTRTQTRLSRAQSRTAPAPTAQPSGASVAPTAGGRTFPPPTQAAIDFLRRGQGTDAQFDEIYGPGAAARARGR